MDRTLFRFFPILVIIQNKNLKRAQNNEKFSLDIHEKLYVVAFTVPVWKPSGLSCKYGTVIFLIKEL